MALQGWLRQIARILTKKSRTTPNIVAKNYDEENYQRHETNYVLSNFQHLMTEVERAAISAVVIYGPENPKPKMHIVMKSEVPLEIAALAEKALANGYQPVRLATARRIVSTHREKVYAHACPNCGLLPATPKARICIWCAHSWFDES